MCLLLCDPVSMSCVLCCALWALGTLLCGSIFFFFFFLRIRRPPRSPLFPSPTLSRSPLPPASLGDGPGLFEPIHGSAPDIAGRDLANPIGAIATVAMLLRHGLGLAEPAAAVERAISLALEQGARTRDIAAPGAPALGTRAMGARIAGLIAEAQRSGAPVTM